MKYVDIVFDGPPSHESGRFVEVEDESGASIKFGEWVNRGDGYWALRVAKPLMADEIREALARYNQWRQWSTNHCDPEEGDPYADSEDSYRYDTEAGDGEA